MIKEKDYSENQIFYHAQKDFILRNIAGETILVPKGTQTTNFNGLISLNVSGVFLWERLQNPCTIGDLVEAMKDKYDVSDEEVITDVREFLSQGLQNNTIIKTLIYKRRL